MLYFISLLFCRLSTELGNNNNNNDDEDDDDDTMGYPFLSTQKSSWIGRCGAVRRWDCGVRPQSLIPLFDIIVVLVVVDSQSLLGFGG